MDTKYDLHQIRIMSKKIMNEMDPNICTQYHNVKQMKLPQLDK